MKTYARLCCGPMHLRTPFLTQCLSARTWIWAPKCSLSSSWWVLTSSSFHHVSHRKRQKSNFTATTLQFTRCFPQRLQECFNPFFLAAIWDPGPNFAFTFAGLKVHDRLWLHSRNSTSWAHVPWSMDHSSTSTRRLAMTLALQQRCLGKEKSVCFTFVC